MPEANGPDRPPADTDGDAVSRRAFVKGAASAAGIATVATFWYEGMGDATRFRRVTPTRPGAPAKHFSPAELRLVEAMVDRLLPSDGPTSPGARDVHAARYIDAVMADEPIPQYLKDRVTQGLPVIEGFAGSLFSRPFAELDDAERDRVIAQCHRTAAHTRFLRFMIELTLECFFCDPARGGNVREIGWKWIQHEPGTPNPSRPGWRPKETL